MGDLRTIFQMTVTKKFFPGSKFIASYCQTLKENALSRSDKQLSGKHRPFSVARFCGLVLGLLLFLGMITLPSCGYVGFEQGSRIGDGEFEDEPNTRGPGSGERDDIDLGDDDSSNPGGDPGNNPPDADAGPIQLWVDLPWSELVERNTTLRSQGLGLIDVESYVVDGERVFLGVWHNSRDQFEIVRTDDSEGFRDKWNEFRNRNLHIIDCEVFVDGNRRTILGSWKSGSRERRMRADANWASLLSLRNENRAAGFRLMDVEAYELNGGIKYTAIWERSSDEEKMWKAGSMNEFITKWREFNAEDLRLIDMEIFVEGGRKQYLGVWRSSRGEHGLWTDASLVSFINKNKEFQERNLVLTDIEVTVVDGSDRKLSGIWRESSDVAVSRLGGPDEF